ncbi:hypothetical protein [Halomicronema hongdechloris]|nr:hypothetical protein [Halomicronema hongdechloris]
MNCPAAPQTPSLFSTALLLTVSLASMAPAHVAASATLADGRYLYGQVPEANRDDTTYMVFELQDGKMVGAFYQPRSSFDCFQGQIQADTMALTVIDSYDQTAFNYEVALQDRSTLVAGVAGTAANPVGYHRISSLSELDHRLLDTCQANQ